MNQLCVYTYHLLFGFPSHLGHCRAWSRVPCAIAVPTIIPTLVIYFIQSINSVYMPIPICQHIPLSLPLHRCVCMFVLYICLKFSFADRFPCTIFLDSTYVHWYMVFIFHFLTYSTLYDSLWVIQCMLLLFSRWVMSDSFETPWSVAHQSPLSMEVSRQESWSGLPFPPPGTFETQGSNLHLLPWQVDFFFYHWVARESLQMSVPDIKCINLFSGHRLPWG